MAPCLGESGQPKMDSILFVYSVFCFDNFVLLDFFCLFLSLLLFVFERGREKQHQESWVEISVVSGRSWRKERLWSQCIVCKNRFLSYPLTSLRNTSSPRSLNSSLIIKYRFTFSNVLGFHYVPTIHLISHCRNQWVMFKW